MGTILLRIILGFIFGTVMFSFAYSAIKDKKMTFKGEEVSTEEKSGTFWIMVVLQFLMGIFGYYMIWVGISMMKNL